MSALAIYFEGEDERPSADIVSIVSPMQSDQSSMIGRWFEENVNYHNILGPAYVDKKSYLDRCPDSEVLMLELGERAAEHLIIDTAMLKTEAALYEHDGWWGSYEEEA